MADERDRKSTSANVQVRLPQDLVARVDELRAAMPVRPSLSETIRFLVGGLQALEERQ